MKSFTIEWEPDPLRGLAEAWTQASDRQAVTDAQDEIDSLLGRDPFDPGKHLSEGLYHIEVPPLVAYYTIDTARRHVTVTGLGVLRS